jgi:hypothetical protein
LLDVSLGYFFADLLYMLIFDPSIVFLLHHIGGITLELLIAASGVGGWYGILGLYLGEITNPIQTVWSGAKYYGYRWLVSLAFAVRRIAVIIIIKKYAHKSL